MTVRKFVLCLGCALLLALPAFAQGVPTGTLSGLVTANNGQAQPGVTVTVSSPALQGTRTAVTGSNGGYNIPLLPPGDYKVTFDREGFQKAERTIKLSAAQASTIDVEMAIAGVTEEIKVVGNSETISATPTASSTYSKQFIEDLPIQRNITDTVLMTPGVNNNGPSGSITISGSQSYESLYLVNGVVVNENLRGQPFSLFIEDAIEETTTSTSGISAEYGRLAGGVINTVTKSGGNEIHGSFRDSYTNDKWTAPTPLTANHSRIDKDNPRYEGTLGGWLVKDRLWYFAAGRQVYTDTSAQTALTKIPYPNFLDEQREEGKLTVSPFEGQRIIASYININHSEANVFGTVLDLASVNDRKLPEDLRALNYTGVVTDNFFLEGQYSKRHFTFEGSGSLFTDIIKGTVINDNITNYFYNSPVFCGVCSPEKRDNENYLGKASWFLSTQNAGSHDLAFGVDYFNDIRKADNHQSGSDYFLYSSDTIIRGNQAFPVFIGSDQSAQIGYWPILNSSKGTNFKTNSAYVNDRWRLNNRFSFNLGARYDKNDGVDSAGNSVAKDSSWSPRLGATYDLKGDGDWLLNASYSKYVTAIANTQGDATSTAGNPALFAFFYSGPDINANPNGPLLTSNQAVQAVFNWFNSVGGLHDTNDLFFVRIPGATTAIHGSLDSPSTTEYSTGVAKRLGSRGLFRTDFVYRKSRDFYSSRIDLSTGKVNNNGQPADLAVIENDNGTLKRNYTGLHTQFQYRATDRLNVGGIYTLSHTYGTVNGETAGSGPVSQTALQYPQYKQASWNQPEGDLNSDQRHRVRVWAIYDIFKTDHNHLNVGLLHNYYSGTPYGAVGSVRSNLFVANPGYALPPATVTYFYTARDAFRTPSISDTDATLNYSFDFNAFEKTVEIFLEPEILNVFNNHNAIAVNASVLDATTTGSLARFNPFTTTPVEGVNWRKGANFGKPTTVGSFQTPRTFRFSVGFRF
jgi:outer membrane receptor protein involved in Fe transport